MTGSITLADYYGAGYAEFASDLYATIRAEAFGEDIGQHSWLTATEHDRFIAWLAVDENCSRARCRLRVRWADPAHRQPDRLSR